MDQIEKDYRKGQIEIELEKLNEDMRTKPFESYSDPEKADYLNKQMELFSELHSLSNFNERLAIGKAIATLQIAMNKLVKQVQKKRKREKDKGNYYTKR